MLGSLDAHGVVDRHFALKERDDDAEKRMRAHDGDGWKTHVDEGGASPSLDNVGDGRGRAQHFRSAEWLHREAHVCERQLGGVGKHARHAIIHVV